MKSPAGKPRARRPVEKRPVQLNLKRTPTWPEEDELNERPDGHFWKWFALVALFHVILFIVLILIFHHQPKPQPEFMTVMPEGETVHGTAAPHAAPKIAPTLPAPSEESTPTPPPPTPKPKPKPVVQKVAPVTPPKPPPIIKESAPTPIAPAVPPKPTKPKVTPKPTPRPPKVKVDLTLTDAPDTDEPPPPKAKPKVHPKKPHHTEMTTPSETDTDSPGLSKAEVAQKLGDQFNDSGTEKSDKAGTSGVKNAHNADFSGFYDSLRNQALDHWNVPNAVDETAVDPVVQIHVDRDGAVPPDRVKLLRTSNNPAFDQAALTAARSMGHTLQPLPDGCPPDISITFNLRQQ